MEKINSKELPEYERPPVVEVVCGVLFSSIDKMLAPHTGLLWEKFKPEYPKCQEKPLLIPIIERVDLAPEPPSIAELEALDIPPLPRIWLINSDDRRVIQIQRDRFLHNWRKIKPENEYPRYPSVIQVFRDCLSKFQLFLTENELGQIAPMQYEMTYVNHIPKGDGWEKLNDVGKIFPDFAWRTNEQRFLPNTEGINWATSFVLPNRIGRLHAAIRSVIRRDDGHPVLLFELTVRGIGADKSIESIQNWFDVAREWIVRGFTDLTSHEIQTNIWRRKR